jgi:hypothetical protein
MDLRDSCCSKKRLRRESMAGIEGNAVLIPYTPLWTLLCARRRLLGWAGRSGNGRKGLVLRGFWEWGVVKKKLCVAQGCPVGRGIRH